MDNLVELSEIGMSIYAGKVASKKITGKLGEESEKLSGLLKKTRKPVSLVSRTKRFVGAPIVFADKYNPREVWNLR